MLATGASSEIEKSVMEEAIISTLRSELDLDLGGEKDMAAR
jgi:hypothetical protein